MSATSDRQEDENIETRPPRPAIALVVCALVAIAALVFLISGAIAALADLGIVRDAASVVLVTVAILPFALVLLLQYIAVFRANRIAANLSAMLLLFVGGLGLLLSGVMFIEMAVQPGGSIALHLWLLVPISLIASFAFLSGCLHLRWAWQLKLLAADGARPVRASHRSRYDILAATVIVTSAAALTAYFIQSTPPRHAEHVSVDNAPSDLPSGATDISYYRGFRGTIAFEFTIDEAGFVKWVESGIGTLESEQDDVRLKEIDEPWTITRYYALSEALDGPRSITIKNGLYYDWTKADRGIHAAFDRNAGRAYCFKHFH